MDQPVGGALTILVVDDEAAIVRMFDRGLTPRGFNVLKAHRGEDAIALYSQHQNEIDLVLLDVQMAPWDGPRTLFELKRVNPHIRVAFVTGETGNYSIERLLALGAVHVFAKPLPGFDELAGLVRQLITNS